MSARKRFAAKVYKAILALHKDQCAQCKCGLTALTGCEFDHIKELRNGGTDTPDNLQPLCFTCHEAKSAAGQTQQAKSVRVKLKNLGAVPDAKRPLQNRNDLKREKPAKDRSDPFPNLPKPQLFRTVP